MPPTGWKQEEEEGKANHRQTLNSLTRSRLQMAPPALCLLLQTAKLLHPSLWEASLPKKSQCSQRCLHPAAAHG